MSVSPAQAAAPTLVVLYADEGLPYNLDSLRADATIRTATAGELPTALAGADALLMWDFTSDALPAAWHAADSLRWIHAASAGVDKLMADEIVRSDVVITNSRGIFDQPMAEYVLALVLAMAKDLPTTLTRQTQRTWVHRETERVGGRSATVVGTGPIGRAICRSLAAAGLRVTLVGRVEATDDPEFGSVYGQHALPDLAGTADYLVLAAPLTPQTRGLVDARLLATMKPSARLINVGRGALVVQSDLVNALHAGRLAGAALDVFDAEPLPADSPLWTLPGVIVSPHMSGDVAGWQRELADLFADNLTRYRHGEPLRNVVDKVRGYVSSGSEL